MTASDARMPWAAARGLLALPRVPGSASLSAAVALVTFAGVVALSPVFRPGPWWALAALVTAVVVGGGAWLRALRMPTIVSVAAPVLAAGVGIVLAFTQASLVIGVLPTDRTLRTLEALSRGGLRSIREGAAPLEVDRPVAFLVLLGVAALAFVLDALTFVARAPAVAGVPLFWVLAVPPVVGDGADARTFVLAAGAYAFLLRAGIRWRAHVHRNHARRAGPDGDDDGHRAATPLVDGQRVAEDAFPSPGVIGSHRVAGGRAVVLAAAAIAGALVLPLGMPTALPRFPSFFAGGSDGTGGGGGLNPILALEEDLRARTDVPVFNYTSSEDRPPYLRAAVLTSFDETTWQPRPFRLNTQRTPDRIGPPPGLTRGVEAQPVTTEIEFMDAGSRWLPAPYAARSIEGLSGDWYWEPSALTVQSREASTAGQRYTVQSIAVRPTREQLARAGRPDVQRLSVELDLPPEGVPEPIVAAANEVTAGLTTDYARAVALQDYFRRGTFSYSEEAPVRGGYDGSGPELIARFLEERSGYCIHFSSAMALLARVVGIPSRVAVGYTYGDRTRDERDGRRLWEVTGRDAHAWPELYFDSVGWIPFEPTPGRGSVPDYASPAASVTGGDDVAPEATAAAGSGVDPREPRDEALGLNQGTAADGGSGGGLGAAALLLLALFAPALARAVVRRARLLRLRTGRGTATDAWREVQDQALDLRMPAPAADTPRAFASRLSAIDGLGEPERGALARVRAAFERESFGRPGSSAGFPLPAETGAALAGDAHLVVTALAAVAPLRVRLTAALLPASLLPSRPGLSRAA
jgi:transglutaminase-like putative cysteine protease